MLIPNKKIFVLTAIIVVMAVFYLGHVNYLTNDLVLKSDWTVEVTPTPDQRAQILFVGDIMLSRSVGALMEQKGDYNWPFLKIANYTRGADLTFANLEDPVSSGGVKSGSQFSFRADPKVLSGLQFAGIDVVSIANNHMWDYGRAAFLDTMVNLTQAGISYVGAGHNFTEAHLPVFKEIKGAKVAFLGYTEFLQNVVAGPDSPGLTDFDIEQMKQDIAVARRASDLVVVSFHWGDEYQTKHNLKQEQFAKAVIDAGADLVIGHHPHVVQGVEKYKNGWIAYSLGNFVFDQNFSQETMHGLALEVNIANKQISGIKKTEIAISREYQPSMIASASGY